MVGRDGLVALVKKLWQLFGSFLNLRDGREILISWGLGVIISEPFVWLYDRIKALPDPAYYALVVLTPVLVAWVISRLFFRPKPIAAPVSPGAPTASALGADSTAVAAGDNALGGTMLTFGNHNAVLVARDVGNADALKVALAGVASLRGSDPTREEILMALATLRQNGADIRNRLIFAQEQDGDVTFRINLAYNDWLNAAAVLIAKLSDHEALSFRLLDRFNLDAAPDGPYAKPVHRWLIAMFSTHLERLEEIRKRYSRPD